MVPGRRQRFIVAPTARAAGAGGRSGPLGGRVGDGQGETEEREDVARLGDDLAGWLARAVAGRGLYPDHNRGVAALSGLERRGELERVTGNDPIVVITSQQQRRRVCLAGR